MLDPVFLRVFVREKTGGYSARLMVMRVMRARFRANERQSGVAFAAYSGWTWRKRVFILPILYSYSFEQALSEIIDWYLDHMD